MADIEDIRRKVVALHTALCHVDWRRTKNYRNVQLADAALLRAVFDTPMPSQIEREMILAEVMMEHLATVDAEIEEAKQVSQKDFDEWKAKGSPL